MGAAGGGLALALVVAATGPERQQIDWEASAGCPSAAAVRTATDAFLGRPLSAYPQTVRARARVEAVPEGYRLQLRIEVEGSAVSHRLSATDCDQLGRDSALLIASAVDPFARGPEPATERQLLVAPVVVQHPRTKPAPEPVAIERSSTAASEPAPAPTKADFSLAVDRPPDDPPAQRSVAGTLGVAGTSFAGLFPQIGGGVRIEGGLERGLLRWQAGATGWFGGAFRTSTVDIGGDLWAVSGSTGVCVAPGRRRFRFAACAQVGAGAITASSVNTENQRTSTRPWVFVGPDLRATWTPRPRLGVYLGVSVLPALVRPGWTVSNPDASFRIPAVAGLLRLGIELRNLGPR